ncbi:hypothetical protein F5B21DRAFT_521097 [Xylaria acuta]|nr:hypothetical protein F5B21DRAFT_521097 [Xylaria acuta]
MANQFHGFDMATQRTWNEGVWTDQEAVLARHKLYLTPAEICSNTQKASSKKAVRNSSEASTMSDDYEDYRRHLERYSRRILTYPSDVCHAFHGVEDAFYSEGGTVFRLLESDFSRAVLWYPNDWPHHLQEQDLTSESRSDFDIFRDAPDYRQFLALEWAEGYIEADVSADLLVSRTGSPLSAEDLASRWPTVGAFWTELLTDAQWSVLRVEHNGGRERFRGDVYVPNVHFLTRHTQGPGKKVGSLLGTDEYRLRGTATPDRAVDVDLLPWP